MLPALLTGSCPELPDRSCSVFAECVQGIVRWRMRHALAPCASLQGQCFAGTITTKTGQLQTCQTTPVASRLAQPRRLAPALCSRTHREGRPATKPALRLSPRSLPGSSGGTAAAAAGCPTSPALKPSSDRSCLAIRFLAGACIPQRTMCTAVTSAGQTRKEAIGHSASQFSCRATKCRAVSSAVRQHSAL